MRTKSSVIGWPRGNGVLAVACCSPGLVQAEYLHPSCSLERYNSETGSTGMDQAVFTKVRKELEHHWIGRLLPDRGENN